LSANGFADLAETATELDFGASANEIFIGGEDFGEIEWRPSGREVASSEEESGCSRRREVGRGKSTVVKRLDLP